jgi:hypothetical protein
VRRLSQTNTTTSASGYSSIDQGAQFIRRRGIGVLLGNAHAASARQRLDRHKEVGFAQALVLLVFSGGLAG